jgi:hypothetical protein
MQLIEGGWWSVKNVDTTPRTYAVEGNIKKKDLTPYRTETPCSYRLLILTFSGSIIVRFPGMSS